MFVFLLIFGILAGAAIQFASPQRELLWIPSGAGTVLLALPPVVRRALSSDAIL